MKLYIPTKADARVLLALPEGFQGYAVVEGSLPPAILLERGAELQTSSWLMPRLFCDEDQREVVGSACFKSVPKDRKVEIGYGVASLRRCRGHATTGLALMVMEAFASSQVDTVLASSSPRNVASRRVLQKCGFVVYGLGTDDDEGPVELWAKTRVPNKPAAPNAGIACRLAIGDHLPGVGEPGRQAF